MSAVFAFWLRLAGNVFSNCSQDFQVYRQMSPGMRRALRAHGLDDFTTAMKFVKTMQAVSGLSQYSLNDLIIYTCLLKKSVQH